MRFTTPSLSPALVVDDNPPMLDAMAIFVSHCLPGIVVHRATTAADARLVLDRHRPTLVVLDVQLPDGNGIDIARELRSARAEVRMVVVSILSREGLEQAALAAGADAFIPKDRLFAELPHVLARLGGRA